MIDGVDPLYRASIAAARPPRAANVPATTFPAPAVTMADGLEDVPDPADDPVAVAEATEVSVVLVMVPVEAGLETPVAVAAAADVLVATESVVADSVAQVSGTVAEALLDEEASDMVDEAEEEEAEERELEAGMLTAAAEVLELELAPPEASILNGKEYWKVLGSESKVIFRPYVASWPRSLPTVQV